MKNSIQYICLLSLFLLGYSLNAQDALTVNDLNFNKASFNSAFIISDAPVNVSLTTSLGPGVQNTRRLNFLAYGNIKKLGIGIGARVNSKFYGLYNVNTAELLYAKELKVNDHSNFYAGLNFGVHFADLNENELNQHVDYEDPFILNNELPQYRFMFGLGFGYTRHDRLKVGFSLPTLMKTNNDFYPLFVLNTSYKFDLFTGSDQHMAGNEISIEPEMMLYGTNLLPLTFEGSVKVHYTEEFWVKAGGRTTKSLLFGFGWHKPFVHMGYVYNANMKEYAQINPGVHNINVHFLLGKKK